MTEAEELSEDYRQVFGSEAGMRVLADICKECSILAPLPEPVLYGEGMRNVGLSILTKIRGADSGGLAILADILANNERNEI